MPATLILTPTFYMIGIDIKRVVTRMFGGDRARAGGQTQLAPAE
jgi:hypothetical protein